MTNRASRGARRPSITTKCVADSYHAPGERIVEFSSANGGGLISFREMEDGTLTVNLYRLDDTVKVRHYVAESTGPSLAGVRRVPHLSGG